MPATWSWPDSANLYSRAMPATWSWPDSANLYSRAHARDPIAVSLGRVPRRMRSRATPLQRAVNNRVAANGRNRGRALS